MQWEEQVNTSHWTHWDRGLTQEFLNIIGLYWKCSRGSRGEGTLWGIKNPRRNVWHSIKRAMGSLLGPKDLYGWLWWLELCCLQEPGSPALSRVKKTALASRRGWLQTYLAQDPVLSILDLALFSFRWLFPKAEPLHGVQRLLLPLQTPRAMVRKAVVFLRSPTVFWLPVTQMIPYAGSPPPCEGGLGMRDTNLWGQWEPIEVEPFLTDRQIAGERVTACQGHRASKSEAPDFSTHVINHFHHLKISD